MRTKTIWFSGEFDVKLTLVEALRGAEAWKRLQEATEFNQPPEEGEEYLLVRLRVEVVSGPPDTQLEVNNSSFTVVSTDGSDYLFRFAVPPTPTVQAALYPGASHEGWAAYGVAINDPAPLLTFGRDSRGRGGVWWKLS